MKSSGNNENDELLWAYIEKTKGRTATSSGRAPSNDNIAGNGASHPEMKELYNTADAVHSALNGDLDGAGAALARARLERLIMEEPISRGGPKRLRRRTPREIATFALLIVLLTALAVLAHNAYVNRPVDSCAVAPPKPAAAVSTPVKTPASARPQVKSQRLQSAN